MQLVEIPNDAPKIGDFYITENDVVFEIEDIIYSSKNRVWEVLLWVVLKYEFLPCELEEFRESSSFYKRKISPEEGNKYTLSRGYDCVTHTYLAVSDV